MMDQKKYLRVSVELELYILLFINSLFMSFSFEPQIAGMSVSMRPASRAIGDIDPRSLEFAKLNYEFEREPINNDPRDGWAIQDTPFDPYGGSDGNMFHCELMIKAAQDHSAQIEIYKREQRRAEQMDKHWEEYLSPAPGYPGTDPVLPPNTVAGNAYGYWHHIRG